MKQIEVQIMGQSYLLGVPQEGDALLLAAVERVDSAMCKIRDSGKVKARERIAVLAALNLAFDLAEQLNVTPQHPGKDTHQPTRELQLTSLLERLDLALSEDGRLI